MNPHPDERFQRREARRRQLRRRRWLLAAVVAALAAGSCLAGLAVARGDGDERETAPAAAPAASPRPKRPAAPAPAPRPTYPKRPQFVVVSFDGSGTPELLRHWRGVGRETKARFTFFLSGVYLLGSERGSRYRPPRRPPGASDIDFTEAEDGVPSKERVRQLLLQLAHTRRAGHEIGTHYNGHFCGAGGVSAWNAADWRRELDEFDKLLTRASELNGIAPPVRLGFGPRQIVGSRTPCLEGNLPVLREVLRKRGYRYDSSMSAGLGTWPHKIGGIWNFPLSAIRLAGTDRWTIAMDYNLMVNHPPAPTLEASREHEEQTYASFVNALEALYGGSRAPLTIGYHFTEYNHGAYIRALERFLRHACRLEDVRCVPHVEVVDWLERKRSGRRGRR